MASIQTCHSLKTAPAVRFVPCNGKTENFSAVSRILQGRLAPLYGDQHLSVEKIRQSTDRRCEILLSEEDPVGVLVYKYFPTNEFAKEGIDRSIEIKTLFLIHPERDSGRGFGSLLLKRVERYATEYFQAKGVHVTVSEMQKDSVGFFQKKGFKEMARWEGKYQKGVKESLLFKKLCSCPEKKAEAVHRIPLKRQYLELIRRGLKTKEGRIDTGPFKALRVGDAVSFFSGSLCVACRIEEIKAYPTFKEMLQDGGVEAFLPNYHNLEDAVALYHSLPGYKEKERRFGTLALTLRLEDQAEAERKTSGLGKREREDADGDEFVSESKKARRFFEPSFRR